MLYEYTQPNIHIVGDIRFVPGMNDVKDSQIKALTPSSKKYFKGLIETGYIVPHKTKAAITVKKVRETADLDLLRTWETDASLKGPIKGAVRKQIAEIESIAVKAEEVEDV